MFKNALVSVSDKTFLDEFIVPLAKQGMRVVSTGGTAKFLESHGVEVVNIEDQTGFPEVMGGRVKTLHPKVHMGLLAREGNSEDLDTLNKFEVEPFDLVVGNLYPFSEALTKNLSFSDQVEYIDIGGPSFLRASAKNFRSVAVVVDPTDYKWVLSKDSLSLQDRKILAAKVFAHTANYDTVIADYFWQDLPVELERKEKSIAFEKVQTLRYGENPQQVGHWYKKPGFHNGLDRASMIQGKALSYNNILDLQAAVATLVRFKDQGPTVVSVKHNNPCGIAVASELEEALRKSLAADPMSVFGGIVAINGQINEGMAEQLTSLFLECVVATSISEPARAILGKKKNLRVLEWKEMMELEVDEEIKSVSGGYLIQDRDPLAELPSQWTFPHGEPEAHVLNDLNLAWKACAQLKSNAISIVSGGQTLGLGMGQVNRVDAVKLAIDRAQKFHPGKAGMVMASDAFFPFSDSIEIAAEAGVKWVIQPGGSIKDKEVLKKASELGVKIVLTGVRHFLH